jgi:hypothetical protein
MGSLHDLWRVAICLLVIPIVAIVFQLTRAHHSGGDPGGRIMAVLKLVEGAVPHGASVTYRSEDGPHWQRCYEGGADGWGSLGVEIRFSSATPGPEIVDAANRVLINDGYTSYGAFRSAARTAASWSGPPGFATVRVTLSGDDSHHKWTLSATAPPVGSRFVCGGG